ncbi:MAG TPA: pyruvate kinase, partial [Solirubrobacterales bacterium]|nr:pyruvate kinase [Solirubrobacterales bacterium]
MNQIHSETRRTKIVATVGPASWDPSVLEQMIIAGVDVFRLNFSHGDEATHVRVIKDVRLISERLDKEVGILGDLPGPKLRVGEYPQGVVDIIHGSTVTITPDDVPGTETLIPVDWPELAQALSVEDTVYLADGSIRLRVVANDGRTVECEVEVGGPLSSHKGMNLPGVEAGLDSVSEDDLRWVEFAVANQLDYIAVSFVRKAEDLDPVLNKLKELRSDIPIIAKIEKPQAADAVEEIVDRATGGIMVARGDLGIEVPLSKVPVLQKSLIGAAGRASKTVITATQMLASMVSAKRPTRAEVTDVATAIYDGTDAIMLSEETAVGEFPVEAVRVMDQIARGTETDLPYWDWVLNRVPQDDQ